MRIKDIGEIRLINEFTRGLKLDRSVVIGPGDDAAVIKWDRKRYLLYTCDMVIEGVHFRRRDSTAFQIGWKALGRNISDIAAMGGLARYATVSIALPPDLKLSFANGIYKGMKAMALKFGVSVVGGDVSRLDKIAIDVSMLGEVEKSCLVTRAGAKEGDLILMTGSVGGSIKGKHLDFVPRLAESRKLVKDFKLTSMIDVTDGLLLDLGRILDASGVGARIYRNAVPLAKEADSFEKAVCEGEDFELLFTMDARHARRFFKTTFCRMPTPVTLIGEIMPKRYGYKMISEGGKIEKIKNKGFLHF